MMYGRARWQEAEATRKDFNMVLTRQDKKFFYLRALQGHSGRNPIDPTLQDNVLIPNNFFECIYYHIGCAVNVHSITSSGLIAGGQNSSRDRQTVFFTAVNPMHENHKDPQELDLINPPLRYTPTAYSVSKVVVMESEEVIDQNVDVSPRPPPKISFKDNWMNELDSEVAGGGEDSPQIQPKSKTQ